MESVITGRAYVLGDNIDTDQIIPAQYLSFNPSIPDERKFFGMYALTSVPEGQRGLPAGNIPFVRPNEFKSDFTIIIGGKNFGCGSSREHAPIALGAAGVEAVVAESYARIFFRNCVATGELYPMETPVRLTQEFVIGDDAEIDLDASTIKNLRTGATMSLTPLGDARPVIDAGGLFEYARRTGMIPSTASPDTREAVPVNRVVED